MKENNKTEGNDALKSTKEIILKTLRDNADGEFIIQFGIEGEQDGEKKRASS